MGPERRNTGILPIRLSFLLRDFAPSRPTLTGAFEDTPAVVVVVVVVVVQKARRVLAVQKRFFFLT
tara:strand:+ start:659 stop:856 length:198 start_codon:yes stop_codon:yes gene_type:complete